MSDPTDKVSSARRRAQTHFAASEERESLIRQGIEKERAVTNAKTVRLKALRLAKEAEDMKAAEAVPPKQAKTSKKRLPRI